MLQFLMVVDVDGGDAAVNAVAIGGRRLGGPAFGPLEVWSGSRCRIAFRRRPIRGTDPAANLPVPGQDGTSVLIGDGRIDRQAELSAALALDRSPARSDQSLMMAAFERWDENAADRLRGDFGFAVWQPTRRRLVLASDCSGTVPLFYCRGDGFIAVSTNPLSLLALNGVSRDLDPLSLAAQISARNIGGERTVYRAIRRLPRAAVAVLEGTASRCSVYWQPRRRPTLRLASDNDYVEAGREVLDDILRGHVRSLHPIGVMLSGGFDSGALAATMARLAPDREILGFTNVPVKGSAETAREWRRVEQLARLHPNIRLQAISEKVPTPTDREMHEVFADIGLPLGGMGLLARRLALARAARQAGVATLLRGDGGNRTLTAEGDEVFRHLFLSGRWWQLGREIAATARYEGQPVLHVLRTRLGRDIAPRPLLGLWRRLRGLGRPAADAGSYLRPGFARDSGLEDAWERAPNRSDRLDLLHTADLESALMQAHPPSADAAILLYARMGLENCAPFRDRRMVDFILSLPVEQFRRNGVPRFFARRVLADRLPPETLAETGYFPHFADCEEWLAGWWDDAATRLAEQHPVELAAAAIDLPRLQARLAMRPPTQLPAYGAERIDVEAALPQALHLNEFLRWHAGANR